MNKLGFIFCFCVFSVCCFSQQTFRVQDFSDRYYGKIELQDPSEIFSAGSVAIYDKATDKLLIKVESEELAVDGDATANVLQLPYGSQSVVIYEDFNFDGIKDFAIEDGQNSCYHGPSFQVYLGTKSGKFEFSESFTELAQDYCGMFDTDAKKQRIYTMTKSGCCWHQWNEYDVVDNKPRLIQVHEEGVVTSGGFLEITDKELKNNKWVDSTYYTLTGEEKPLFYFQIAKNKKKVYLFNNGGCLQYAFMTADNKLEFAYPSINGMDADSLTFEMGRDSNNKKREWIDFANASAHYQIYNEPGKVVGIKVTVKGKVYDMKGDVSTCVGEIVPIFFENALTNVNFVDDK